MVESLFNKKFSIGISLQISLDEYEMLMDEFGLYIHDVYFSLPLGKQYHSRMTVIKEFEEINAEEKFLEVLKLLKRRGIKLEAVLNTTMLTSYHVEKAMEYIDSKIEIDSVVTLQEFGEIVKRRYPQKQLVFSYNNGIRENAQVEKISSVFNEIVVGNSCIRDFEMLAYIKEKNFETKLLLNNGCSFNCSWCRNSFMCKSTFEKNLQKYSAEELYALQTILPWELNKYILKNGNIDRFKISNRPCSYEYLKSCLGSYIYNYDRALISKNPKFYHLWGRLAQFSKYYNTFDFVRITEIKERIWKNPVAWKM